MPGVSKIPYVMRDVGDVVLAARAISTGRISPVFFASSVTSHGLDRLLRFLSLLPRRRKWDHNGDLLMYISDIYLVKGVGVVIGGLVDRGVVRVGDKA